MPSASKKKRVATDESGGTKRHKAAYASSKHVGRSASHLGPGMRGVLITCDVHMEKAAIGEAFRLIDELLEAEHNVTSAAADPVEHIPTHAMAIVTAGDSLAAELAAMQQQKPQGDGTADDARPKRRYTIAQTGCPGNVFIRLADGLDPLRLVDRAMDQALASGASGARHVVRMMPVQLCVSAHKADAFAEAVKPLAQAAMRGFRGTYAVHWRRRNNSSLDKMSVIDAVAAEVGTVAPDATVDLRNSEAAISVEVIQTTGLVSVLPRWRELLQYNLRACAAAKSVRREGVEMAGAAGPGTASVMPPAAEVALTDE